MTGKGGGLAEGVVWKGEWELELIRELKTLWPLCNTMAFLLSFSLFPLPLFPAPCHTYPSHQTLRVNSGALPMDTAIPSLFSCLPPYLQTLVLLVCVLAYLTGHFLANTNTPPPNTAWGRVYAGLETFANLYGKAKQVGVPLPPSPDINTLLTEIAQLRAQVQAGPKASKEQGVPGAAEVTATSNTLAQALAGGVPGGIADQISPQFHSGVQS